MKVNKSMFAVTCLLLSVGNVFAEGNWQFGLEIGSPWIECNSNYTGSTADALGCPANSPSDKRSGLVVLLNKKPESAGFLKPATDTTDKDSDDARHQDIAGPSFDDVDQEPDVFWTMDNGETLNHSQVLISAMLQPARVELALNPGVDIKPGNLDSEKAVTAIMVPVRANDPGQ